MTPESTSPWASVTLSVPTTGMGGLSTVLLFIQQSVHITLQGEGPQDSLLPPKESHPTNADSS